jgi:hypothetical protein
MVKKKSPYASYIERKEDEASLIECHHWNLDRNKGELSMLFLQLF